jgi:hypothetical protein
MASRKQVTKTETPTESKIYWVALKLNRWDKIGLESNPLLPFPVQFQAPNDGEIGFLPVFSTPEGALKYVNWDKNLIGQIREIER